jgi:hypothetical protein
MFTIVLGAVLISLSPWAAAQIQTDSQRTPNGLSNSETPDAGMSKGMSKNGTSGHGMPNRDLSKDGMTQDGITKRTPMNPDGLCKDGMMSKGGMCKNGRMYKSDINSDALSRDGIQTP